MLYPFSLTLDLYIQAESFEEAKKLAEAYVQDASLDTTDYPEIVQDVLEVAEARKLWRAVSAMHRGAEFRHGLVEDITGRQWSLNRYENDLLTAGCHRIAYNEMERIAKQLGWV